MNVRSLEFNFADFYIVTIHDQNVGVVFNFAEIVRPRIKAFTVTDNAQVK